MATGRKRRASPLTRVQKERDEALRFQAATSEILAALSRSTSHPQPVFEAIVDNVLRLFDTRYAAVFGVKGDELHLLASKGDARLEKGRAVAFQKFRAAFPQRIDWNGFTGKALRTGKVSQMAPIIGNPKATPQAVKLARDFGYDAMLVAPLMKDGKAIGAIGTTRPEDEPFDARQLALFEAFAAQAVIAIENARLFNETKQALERQTATAEILQTIARSQTDVQPVFDAMVRHAARLCNGLLANVFRYDGEKLHFVATSLDSARYRELLSESYPMVPNRSQMAGRAILAGKVVRLEDALADPDYDQRHAKVGGWRRIVGVPLMRRGSPIGVIVVTWAEAGPVPREHEGLLRTFADQAVIAIENVRLFNETKESLEQQTAISEVLRVISGSPADLAPVLGAVANRAAALCQATDARIFLLRDGTMHYAAGWGDLPVVVTDLPLSRASVVGRTVLDRAPVHIDDIKGPAGESFSVGRDIAARTGWRTALAVPLMRDDRALGAITLRRRKAQPYSEKQIALLKTFADQAVIAIENARLFNETKEALEQQTAIAEVLRVISDSPADVRPVLEAVAERALRICDSYDVRVFLVTPEGLRYVAGRGSVDMFPIGTIRPLTRGLVMGRAVLERRAIQVEDLTAEAREYPEGIEVAKRFGHRTTLAVPLLREDKALGVLLLRRLEVRPFTEKQVNLLKTFADQAAIAIENVRLFNETKEALERQTATADILRVISSSPTDEQPVFDRIAERATTLCSATIGVVSRFDGELVHLVASYGTSPAAAEAIRVIYPMKPGEETATARAIRDRGPVQIADVLSDPRYAQKAASQEAGYRSVAAVPMLRDGKVIGAIAVTRPVPGLFSDKHVQLLETFADQAVIAIENVRLFKETNQALERQTATAEILGVIGSSVMDTQPVFDAIVRNCSGLFSDSRVALWLVEGERLECASSSGYHPEPMPLDLESGIGTCVLEGRILHLPDLAAAAAARYKRVRQLGLKHGYGSGLYAPLVREGKPIGALSVLRRKTGAFEEKDVGLLGTFASQAVIAIENARLFNETKEALERQTATAEILRVISSSPTDEQPVFDAIVDSAARLFRRNARIRLVEGNELRLRAHSGHAPGDQGADAVMPLDTTSLAGRVVLKRQAMQVADTQAADAAPLRQRTGYRSVAAGPLVREGIVMGVITVWSAEPGALSEKEMALLQTFADQAVIAIENVRLFREIQEKSAQLEVANKHKSDFLANMSHELRTPLNAVIGFSEVLLDKMFGEVNEKQVEYLKDIHESGRHLLSLINDILDLSKIEAGRMELDLSEFHLPTAVSNAITLVRERAQRHGIALGAEIDPALGGFQGDERKVKQILLNLLSNAVKFTPDGGKVDVLARKTDGKVEIAVRDTGIGIAPEDHAAVFEEFKQVGRDYTRKAEGTGLGLALTKRLVELHGGDIALESAPGKGSTFTVKLPLR